jgi:hypothetical protein
MAKVTHTHERDSLLSCISVLVGGVFMIFFGMVSRVCPALMASVRASRTVERAIVLVKVLTLRVDGQEGYVRLRWRRVARVKAGSTELPPQDFVNLFLVCNLNLI